MLSKMTSCFVIHATGVGDHLLGAEGAVENDIFFVNHGTEVWDHLPGNEGAVENAVFLRKSCYWVDAGTISGPTPLAHFVLGKRGHFE